MHTMAARGARVLRRQKVMVVGLLLLGLSLPFVVNGVASSATYGHATLSCQASVAVGTTFTVKGSKFPSHTTVKLSDGVDIGAGETTTDATGSFTANLTVSLLAVAGSDIITATAADGTSASCTVDVTV